MSSLHRNVSVASVAIISISYTEELENVFSVTGSSHDVRNFNDWYSMLGMMRCPKAMTRYRWASNLVGGNSKNQFVGSQCNDTESDEAERINHVVERGQADQQEEGEEDGVFVVVGEYQTHCVRA